MEIKIESPHVTLNAKLNDFIREKVIRLELHDERLIRSEVCMKIDNSSTDNNKVCEIRVVGPQHNLFAAKRSSTFEESVTETVHALEKQLGKQKTKNEKGKEKIEVADTEEGVE